MNIKEPSKPKSLTILKPSKLLLAMNFFESCLPLESESHNQAQLHPQGSFTEIGQALMVSLTPPDSHNSKGRWSKWWFACPLKVCSYVEREKWVFSLRFSSAL